MSLGSAFKAGFNLSTGISEIFEKLLLVHSATIIDDLLPLPAALHTTKVFPFSENDWIPE